MSSDEPIQTNRIVQGDCLEVMQEFPEESAHAVVTDPPYGIAFMSRGWDDFEPKEYQEWCEQWAREVKRVLKPGGHLLAFSGNRTHHRLFTGVEDAGFEVRDTLTWHYGSGFPKASDVSKTIDKRADAEREVVGEKTAPDGVPLSDRVSHSGEEYDDESADYDDCKRDVYEREPATDAAEEWDGWKTGLKPATEFVVMARKPFDGATVDCVLEHGTGALNIRDCRVGFEEGEESPSVQRKENSGEWTEGALNAMGSNHDGDVTGFNADSLEVSEGDREGRYPANVVFGEQAAADLDEQVGELSGGARTHQSGTGRNTSDAPTRNDPDERVQLESGGPSRYFYTSKASRSERTLGGSIENAHPTVKPQDLMEWLVQLVTRDGQIVLDPFAGSGTTCKAAKELSREFIGIERQEKWADVARVRCNLNPDDPSVVRADNQAGVEEF